jgi:hypothetical protein
MFSLEHRSLHVSFFIVLVQALSIRSDAVSANKRDISNHIPVLATLIVLNNDVSTDKNEFTDKKQSTFPDFTKWHGLSSVNALHEWKRGSIHTQEAPTTHKPIAISNVDASHMKESKIPTSSYKRRDTYKYGFGCGSIQGIDTTTIEFTVSIHSSKYSIHDLENYTYTHSIANKFGLKECSVHVVSQTHNTYIVSSNSGVLTHTISDVIQSKTNVRTRIYAPTDEVVHLMETLKDGPMHIFIGEELVKVYVSETKIVVSPLSIGNDESEIINWSEFESF